MFRLLIALAAALLISMSSSSANAADLPDPFLFSDVGRRVKSADDWTARRLELQELILHREYGPLPPAPKHLASVLLVSHRPRKLGALHRQYKLTCDPGDGCEKISFVLDLLIPSGSDKPMPVVLRGDACWGRLGDDVARKILDRGYILAEFNRCEIAPDTPDRKVGLYASYPGGEFGAIAAWAWGFHRCVDFLVNDPHVDRDRIAVTGHSRGGKAALLAGATDTRIALTAPNCSGCGGAGCFLLPGPESERIENIVASFPFWFTPRFKEFAGREEQLPFDQHELKALCAPRALLSTEALDDLHANPQGTFQTHRAAREVYQFLGHTDRIAIWFRPGIHEHNGDDFAVLLDFADQVFFNKPSSRDWNRNPYADLPRAFSWTAPAR
jgi:hypothetical protein